MSFRESLGLLDSIGLAPSIFAADAMLKAAPVKLAEIEYSGGLEITTKILGTPDAVALALDVGQRAAGKRYENRTLITMPAEGLDTCIDSHLYYIDILSAYNKLRFVREPVELGPRIAFGIIEAIGSLPLIAASDDILKAADVNLIKTEKIGGMMISAHFHGKPDDMKRAIDTGVKTVERFGDYLIGAYVIENPHPGVRKLVYGVS